MSVPGAMPPRARAGAESILHPQFLRERLAPLLSNERSTGVVDHRELFAQLRVQARGATASVGAAHDGVKGHAVHRAKIAIQRSLYWYVDPAFAALRTTNLVLIDTAESLSLEVERLRYEVASLRRDHESDIDARHRAMEHPASCER